ncbi:hypothetical protein [Demequina capsici]|uniref:Uncharacterized protein n=1 Tax=Demequina capsici TaxID=3075620 RepID=A0AA96F5X3_9MICO|nr:hypothetical protein [Demequina sp. OYTSA14]WNM24696.1 hypothetical protein RN606_00680 [Demequina sp. OYTSA14]
MAVGAGVDQTQIDALADGSVTFDEYEQAIRATITCMRDAGIEVDDDQVDYHRPFPEIPYTFAGEVEGVLDGDQTLAVADGCIETYSQYVDMAYQTDAAAQEAIDAYFVQVRDEFIACLEDQGQTVDPDATDDELRQAAVAAMATFDGPNCFTVTGAR